MDRNRGLDKDQAAAERRDRKVPGRPDRSPAARRTRRQRKPAVLGIVVAASAVGAWLLRRERFRAPEGTWRDALLSDAPGKRGTPRTPGSGTDER